MGIEYAYNTYLKGIREVSVRRRSGEIFECPFRSLSRSQNGLDIRPRWILIYKELQKMPCGNNCPEIPYLRSHSRCYGSAFRSCPGYSQYEKDENGSYDETFNTPSVNLQTPDLPLNGNPYSPSGRRLCTSVNSVKTEGGWHIMANLPKPPPH